MPPGQQLKPAGGVIFAFTISSSVSRHLETGPLPTYEDALVMARERTALLTEGLGEWVSARQEREVGQPQAGWRRNAYRTGGPDDWRTWWRGLFHDDE